MSNGNGFSAWKDRIAWAAVAGLVAGGISWAAWMTVRQFNTPTNSEVLDMIRTSAPYTEDRKLIMGELERIDKTESRLATVIENNTLAVNELRVHLARIETKLHRSN